MAQTLTEIRMPKLAESVVSATISKWLKQPGDYIEEYEPLCEIITDKVTSEVPCTVEGTLAEIKVEEGMEVDVGTVICSVKESEAAEANAQVIVHDEPASSVPSTVGSKSVSRNEQEGNANDWTADQSMRKRLSPVVRKLVEEHNIDLDQVQGSGIGGRITRKDVLQYITKEKHVDSHQLPVRSSGLHLTPAPAPKVQKDELTSVSDGEYFVDVTPVRNTIATRMRQSVSEIPHAWTMMEVDVTNLVLLRNRVKDEFLQKEGINLTYLAFVIKAVVNAIKDYPILNSVWAVNKIIVKRDINISLAVGTEDSVHVPVIKNADQKNIAGLAREIFELTRKARAGKLTPSDIEGGTFTVNNTGSFGSILSQPIINYPQAANFTFESIVKRPVVIDDMIAVRSMANICLSLDHRILDGVICGRFLQRVKENIESYGPDTKLY